MDFTQQSMSDQKAWGLRELLEGAFLHARTDKTQSSIWRATYLESHPFNLPIPDAEERKLKPPRKMVFIGHPGYTDSVSALIAYLAEALSILYKVSYLRVIYAENEQGQAGHQVYFEVGTAQNIFLVSGCTDYSGGGKEGSRRMQRVFTALAQLFEVEAMEERIARPESHQIGESLREKVDCSDV